MHGYRGSQEIQGVLEGVAAPEPTAAPAGGNNNMAGARGGGGGGGGPGLERRPTVSVRQRHAPVQTHDLISQAVQFSMGEVQIMSTVDRLLREGGEDAPAAAWPGQSLRTGRVVAGIRFAALDSSTRHYYLTTDVGEMRVSFHIVIKNNEEDVRTRAARARQNARADSRRPYPRARGMIRARCA